MNLWQEIKLEYQRWKKRKEYLKNLKIKYEKNHATPYDGGSRG